MTDGPVELVLDRGTVLTLDADRTVLDPGWVATRDGRIVDVGQGESPPANQVIDCSGDLVMPGFVNAHAHLLGAFVRGMGGDRATTPRATAERPTVAVRLAMSEEDAYCAARLALLEMQLSGVTTTTDSQPALAGLEGQADGTLRAISESGMRAIFYRASVDRTEFFPRSHHDTAELAALEFERLLSTWSRDRVDVGIEPMALHRVSDELLVTLVDLARSRNAPLAIHGPYGAEAASHPVDRWGKTATQVLEDVSALGPTLLIHHPVVMDDDDIRRIADHDAAVSVCTVDNLLIGTGPARIPSILDAGVRVGLGLDQPNDGHDMFELMKLTMLVHRDASQEELWGSPELMLELATDLGASALSLDAGTIEPGRWADVVVIDGSHPTMLPRHTAISNLVLAAGPQAIRSVYVKGRLTVDRGRHLVWNSDEVVEEADRAMHRCLDRAGLDANLWTKWNRG